MTKALPSDLLEATRLTRAGRLGEATSLLQRMLRGEKRPANDDASSGAGPIIDGVAERIEEASPESPPTLRARRGILDLVDGGLQPGLGGMPFRSRTEAPPAIPEGARFLAGDFRNEAGSRPYKLYVPSRYRDQPVPLIVMLHGCTQSPDDFASGTRMNEAAEEHDCLVLYPAQTMGANPSKCWNWFNAGDQQRDRGEPALIAGLTRQIMRDYAIDPRRVYVAGLSAGGAAAANLGTAYPDLYAAIGVHSGLACGAASDLPSAFTAMRQGGVGRNGAPRGQRGRSVPAIVFHGDRDTTVHPCNGDAVIAQSAPASPLEIRVEEGGEPGGRAWRRTLHAQRNGEVILEQWVIHGAGHAWAGGSAAGSFTDPQGPSATREMLRFFLEHKLPT